MKNAEELAVRVPKYDPIKDGLGQGINHYNGLPTRPGGHYRKIIDIQTSLRKDISSYLKDCINCDDDCDPDRQKITVPKWVTDAVRKPVAPPVYPEQSSFFGDYQTAFADSTTSQVLVGAGAAGLFAAGTIVIAGSVATTSGVGWVFGALAF